MDGVDEVDLVCTEMGGSDAMLGSLAVAMESDDEDVVLQVCPCAMIRLRLDLQACHRPCLFLQMLPTVLLTSAVYCHIRGSYIACGNVLWMRRSRFDDRPFPASSNWFVKIPAATASFMKQELTRHFDICASTRHMLVRAQRFALQQVVKSWARKLIWRFRKRHGKHFIGWSTVWTWTCNVRSTYRFRICIAIYARS